MVSQRYTCNLSSEVLQKAHNELFEPLNNNERLDLFYVLKYLMYNITYITSHKTIIIYFYALNVFNL